MIWGKGSVEFSEDFEGTSIEYPTFEVTVIDFEVAGEPSRMPLRIITRIKSSSDPVDWIMKLMFFVVT